MLALRVATAVIGIPLLLAVTYAGGWVVAVATAVLALAGNEEMLGLTDGRLAVSRWLLRLWAPGLALLAGGYPHLLGEVLAVGLLTVLALTGAKAIVTRDPHAAAQVPSRIGPTLLVLAYPSLLLAYLVLLRAERGFAAVWLTLATIWVSDTLAYFCGRLFGRVKLAPLISPGKTVEGALAGLAGGAAAGWLAHGAANLSPAQGALFGLAVSLAGLLGDLFESAIKRGAGVKDSGRLLPGHGGVLDRFDSLAFGLPAAFYFFAWAAGSSWVSAGWNR